MTSSASIRTASCAASSTSSWRRCAPTPSRQTGDGQPKQHLSFKLDPTQIPELPLPQAPLRDFRLLTADRGCAPTGGKVARGGIRWSDRREDFRTEVLGLMKAQMVKNVVIVPVGAKGGFVVKRPPVTTRDAMAAEVVACYRTFISGLLDLTDNRQGDKVVPPADVVRYDDDDPYLVVAADKGTATFSDVANSISMEHGFWLGDAFASGGSAGYDHKEIGITARGAWESVKRHFRNLGTDVQSTDVTVIGIGDMSGDVFGNGMVLSASHQADRSLQPPPYLPRPQPRPRGLLPRAGTALRVAPFHLGGLRPRADLQRGWDMAPHRQVDPALARGPPDAQGRCRADDAKRADPRLAGRTGRPPVERGHRHLRQGILRVTR